MYILEEATDNDIALCCKIIDDGRRFQQAQGFVHGPENYPNKDKMRY